LLKYQLDSSWLLISLILMTTLFYTAVILQGEIWRSSLLGLKGLSKVMHGRLRGCKLLSFYWGEYGSLTKSRPGLPLIPLGEADDWTLGTSPILSMFPCKKPTRPIHNQSQHTRRGSALMVSPSSLHFPFSLALIGRELWFHLSFKHFGVISLVIKRIPWTVDNCYVFVKCPLRLLSSF